MRKVIVLVMMFAFMASVAAFASDTAKGNYANPAITEWINSTDSLYHTHNYSQTSKYRAPLGVGVDLTLYEIDVKGVGLGFGVDTEYDMNNGVFGVMGKVRVNTTGLINALIGK